MLSSLRFTQGAVAQKDYQPALTHFRIAEGRIMGYNGLIALSSPIDLDLTASPSAKPFISAVERCTDEQTVVHVTPAGRLSIRSGAFQAYIDCIDDASFMDAIVPEGEPFPVEGERILSAFRVLEQFVGTDATRQWATGVLLRGCSAYATNNVLLLEYWLGACVAPCDLNIPSQAVAEIVRIGEPPHAMSVSDRSVTFYFSNDRWLRTQLHSTSWPEAIAMILEQPCEPVAFPPGFFDAVHKLIPFVAQDGRVYMRTDRMATRPQTGEEGATIRIEGLPASGAFHHHFLMLLKGVATEIDFSLHPSPCPFRGKNLRGAIMAMRDE